MWRKWTAGDAPAFAPLGSRKAMADQIIAADKSRLTSPLGQLNKADMQAVEDAIRVHLGLAK